MITFKKLGHYGRLGNQMFQYAALRGIADKIGTSAGIDYKNAREGKVVNSLVGPERLELLNAFPGLRAEDSSNHAPRFAAVEPHFNFSEEIYSIPDDTDLTGYFQTDRYFAHIEDEIREEFTFKPEIIEAAKSKVAEVGDGPVTSIHIRRGDYTKIQDHHPLCTEEYYTSAYEDHCEGSLIVVSDDTDWVESNWDLPNAYYVKDTNQFIDMCIISLCDHCIIANSTFSWWGAWLNQNGGNVVAPSNWFGERLKGHDISDLIPEGWNVI